MVKDGASRPVAGQREQGPKFSISVLEKVGSSIIVTDLAGKITYWNKRAEEMRGWKSEEVIGKPIFDVVPPESRELANAIMKKIAKSGSWAGEFEAIRKDATRFQTMSSDEALEDWNGRAVGMIDVSVDITNRKQMEKRLRCSEEKFMGIAERSFDGIWKGSSPMSLHPSRSSLDTIGRR
jgi:PAS domain S-box-containing protein